MAIASMDARSDPALAATSLETETRARAGIAKVAGLGTEGVGIGA